MNRDLLNVAGVALLLIGLGSCASTKLTESWRDPNLTAPEYGKVLVIGMAQRAEVRTQFERAFVAGLRDRGLSAVPSFEFLPRDAEMTREVVEKALEGSDIDAVLVTRFAGIEVDAEYQSGPAFKLANPYDQGFAEYYEIAYETAFAPSYAVAQQSVLLETRFFDVGTGKLAWTAKSKSLDPDSAGEVIKPLSKLILDRLSRDGMI